MRTHPNWTPDVFKQQMKVTSHPPFCLREHDITDPKVNPKRPEEEMRGNETERDGDTDAPHATPAALASVCTARSTFVGMNEEVPQWHYGP